MSRTVIKIEQLSKVYRLGEIGTGTLSHDLNRWWARTRGKQDPFTKVAEVNDRTIAAVQGESIWALKNIDLEVEKGEVLGIIGKNGAGKSTLLKILSRVTSHSTGLVKIKGRIASLLEVGTGFHPEMTGRENIFMNGTIMGMRKKEIQSKLDEIVDFAGVAKYLDTPTKRYSSGMTVRLGFAVAAFLEPEILVVDEVLAVGDAEFQKKAVGKMQDVSKEHGRTVLFVSHNMTSVRNLCQKALVLNNGEADFLGEAGTAIDHYLENRYTEKSLNKSWSEDSSPGNDRIKIEAIEVSPEQGNVINIDSGLEIKYRIKNFSENINLGTTLELINREEVVVFHRGIVLSSNKDSKKGRYEISVKIPPHLLNANTYRVQIMFGENQKYLIYKTDDILNFDVENTMTGQGANLQIVPGVIRPELKWEVAFID